MTRRYLPIVASLLLTGAFLVSVSSNARPRCTASAPHVVLFKFKADAPQEKVQEVVDAFARLPKQIDAIKDFEAGTDNSPEMKSRASPTVSSSRLPTKRDAISTCPIRLTRRS